MKVLLVNLGGPRNREEIEKFLLDLFGDKYVFDLPLPEFLRSMLGRFIAVRRAPKVADAYSSMGYGGGSPLFNETSKQARALEAYIQDKTQKNCTVKIAMTCGEPNIRNLSIEELTPTSENIIVPMFPHFSRSTTMSLSKIIESITKVCPANPDSKACGTECSLQINGKSPCASNRVGWVKPFHPQEKYISATGDLILEFLRGQLDASKFIGLKSEKIIDWENLPILFSAHGIPMRLVNKGDIYVQEIESNKIRLEEYLRKNGYRGQTYLSFQSRVGPGKWTAPNTINKLQEIGAQGVSRIAIYPISFVSDHLETLVEIGVELKEIAHHAGITEFFRIPSFGVYPKFIEFLGDEIIASSKII